uniref:Uncharacterized protein n=1 Tax=Rhizophora mucronata TaxID=61149 RepID=A0A2P2NXE2_RHIMU
MTFLLFQVKYDMIYNC